MKLCDDIMDPWRSLGGTSAVGGGVDKWCRDGQQSIIQLFGAAAYDLILPGNPASGNIVTAILGNVLTPVTTPLYQQALTGLPGDPLGAGFDRPTTDSFDAATNAVYEFAAGSFAILCPFRVTNAGAGILDVFGKRIATEDTNGYTLGISTDAIRWNTASGAGANADDLVFDNDTTAPHYAFVWSDSTGTGIYGDYGTAATATPVDVTNTALFALGSARLNACGVTVGPMPIWTGASADIVIAGRATSLPAWWAL